MISDESNKTATHENAVLAGYPLTEAQMEIRLSAQLGDEESCAFNEGFTLTLRGPLNENALHTSIEAVMERHEVLRATLNSSGDRFLIHSFELSLPIVDLSAFHQHEQDRQIADLKEREAWKAFDLMTGPLIRMQLVRRSPESYLLMITAHRIIFDHRSAAMIATEIAQIYTALCSDEEIRLPEPARLTEYKQLANTHSNARVEAYWDLQFSEATPLLKLPLDHPRPATISHRGATYIADFGREALRHAQEVSADQDCTTLEILLAGFHLFLTNLTGQSDIVIGVPSTNAGDAPLVGQCANLLPIRLQTSTRASFADLLKETQQKLFGANENSSYPYGTLVRKLASPRSAERLPLIEVLFHMEQADYPLNFHNLTARVYCNPKRFVNFDLSLHLVNTAGKIRVYCHYNADLFDEVTIVRWMREYEDLFVSACQEINQPVAQLAIPEGVPLGPCALDSARIFRHRINLGELFK